MKAFSYTFLPYGGTLGFSKCAPCGSAVKPRYNEPRFNEVICARNYFHSSIDHASFFFFFRYVNEVISSNGPELTKFSAISSVYGGLYGLSIKKISRDNRPRQNSTVIVLPDETFK